MSYLNEQSLQANRRFQGREELRAIPEDRSDVASVPSGDRWRGLQRDGDTRSETASSTGGVLDGNVRLDGRLRSVVEEGTSREGERRRQHFRRTPNEETNGARCVLSRNVLVFFILLLMGCGVGLYFVVRNTKKPSNGMAPREATSIPPSWGPTMGPTTQEMGQIQRLLDFLLGLSSTDALADTPQGQALDWVVNQDEAQVRLDTDGIARVRQRFVLVVLYFSLNGTQWTVSNFLSTDHECDWTGITCINDLVTGLDLEQSLLQGSLPREIARLDDLRTLNLSMNQITGYIPPALFNLQNLRLLDLSNNKLSGNIKPRIWRLPRLQEVYLRNNNFTGSLPYVPPGVLSGVRGFDVRENQLTGSIPESYSKLSFLQAFIVSGNRINGTLPNLLYNWNDMQWLIMNNNQFSGTISPRIWEMPFLKYGLLYGNSFSGPFPPVMTSQLPSLERIDLMSNQLTGTIPQELLTVTSLTRLRLSNNSLTGTLPEILNASSLRLFFLDVALNSLTGTLSPSVWDVPSLQFLLIHSNILSGTFPPFPQNTNIPLRYLWCHSNLFEGSLPDIWSAASNLDEIDFFENNFDSEIPQSLFGLANLSYIDLSTNRFTGMLPALENVVGLQYLFVNSNRLEGSLPPTMPPPMRSAWFHSNQFSGSIPNQLGALNVNLTELLLQNNTLSGMIPATLCGRLTKLEADCLDPSSSNYVACSSDCCTMCF